MDEIRLKTPAKINLFLEIKGPRPDGFHDIVTLYHEIDLYDEIIVRRASGEADTLRIIPGGAADPPPATPQFPIQDLTPNFNLTLRALDALRRHTGIVERFEIELVKRIPIGAGLGGGSSDAAAVIKAVNTLSRLGLGESKMERIAAAAGADAPFFIRGGAAVGRGRGDELTPIPTFRGGFHLALAVPRLQVATPWAYAQAGAYRGTRDLDTTDTAARLAAGDRDFLESLLFNAFEEIVFPRRPQLENLKECLLKSGCAAALLCGSGSALFGLCRTAEEAEHAKNEISREPAVEVWRAAAQW